jgi:hypothetical protein
MRRNKGLVLLTLVALAAFTITATIGGSASASGGNAVAAKKKCKKKKVSSAKKKKCKKKKKTTPVAPISMVRATLTWSGGGDSTDYNLYVFDSSGNTGRAGSDPIANTSFSPNAVGSSRTETFTDLDFGQHRAFDFGVCKQDGGTDGSSYTIDYVTADGVHHTDAQSSHDDGYAARYSDSLPPNAPNGFAPCPIP